MTVLLCSCNSVPAENFSEENVPSTENLSPEENTVDHLESSGKQVVAIPQKISSKPLLTAKQLTDFFMYQAPASDMRRVERLAELYVSEAKMEGVNSDIAFVQMCLETGFLSFGRLVSPNKNNFCGLGALNESNPGLAFEDEQTGVRAHIQHLKGYATDEPLVNACVDPRFKYIVPKGKAPHIKDLTGTWASDPEYGIKLESLLERMYEISF